MDKDYYIGVAYELKRRLEILITEDVEKETFGVNTYGNGHQFQLGATLPEEKLAEFETEYGVTLPGEYRAFLKHIGNGGAGPGYGMTPLELAIPRRRGIYGNRILASPFEHTQWIGFNDDEEIPFTEVEGSGYFHGCLHLAKHGDGIEDFLIVTGPCRGQIWTDDTCSDCGIHPTAASFYFWYDAWLSTSLLELYSKMLGKPI